MFVPRLPAAAILVLWAAALLTAALGVVSGIAALLRVRSRPGERRRDALRATLINSAVLGACIPFGTWLFGDLG